MLTFSITYLLVSFASSRYSLPIQAHRAQPHTRAHSINTHTHKRTHSRTQACKYKIYKTYKQTYFFFSSEVSAKNRVFSCALSSAAVCLSVCLYVCLFGWLLRLLWCLYTYGLYCMRFAEEEKHPSLNTMHRQQIRRWRGTTVTAPAMRLPIQRKSKNQTHQSGFSFR